MSYKLRNFILEPLNLRNTNHYKMVQSLSRDAAVDEYISRNFEEFVTVPKPIGKYDVKGSYIVSAGDNRLGMIGGSGVNKKGIYDLWYTVCADYRGENLGAKILAETTLFLLDEVKSINDIELIIKMGNIASSNTAESVGYNYVGIDCKRKEERKVYRYFDKNK